MRVTPTTNLAMASQTIKSMFRRLSAQPVTALGAILKIACHLALIHPSSRLCADVVSLEAEIRGATGTRDERVAPILFDLPPHGAIVFLRTVVQPDGKRLAMLFDSLPGVDATRGRLFRVNPDGSMDQTFIPQLAHDSNGGPDRPSAYYYGQPWGSYTPTQDTAPVWLQPDGQILIRGSDHPANAFNLVRLMPDGSRDNSFNPSLGRTEIPSRVLVQTDGRLIVVGDFGIRRLNTDGSLDSTFNVQFQGGLQYREVPAVALQSDGRLLMLGNFEGANGLPTGNLVRLESDGTMDPTFVAPPRFSTGSKMWSYSIGLARNGGIVIATPDLVRLKRNGDIDDTFHIRPGIYATSLCGELPDGAWLAGVSDAAGWNNFLRINPDGSWEWGAPLAGCFGVNLRADGTVLGVFSEGNSRASVVQLHAVPEPLLFTSIVRELSVCGQNQPGICG